MPPVSAVVVLSAALVSKLVRLTPSVATICSVRKWP